LGLRTMRERVLTTVFAVSKIQKNINDDEQFK